MVSWKHLFAAVVPSLCLLAPVQAADAPAKIPAKFDQNGQGKLDAAVKGVVKVGYSRAKGGLGMARKTFGNGPKAFGGPKALGKGNSIKKK